MSTTNGSTKQSKEPHYAQPSRTAKAAVAFIAVLLSSTLLGGMLGLFEMHSEDAAMAKAARTIEPARTGLAAAEARAGSRS